MYSFPTAKRLLKRSDFERVLESGERIATSRMVAVLCHGEEHARLGLIVSKKVGNAVHRNRVKRMIRECFRHLQAQLPAVDIVVIARAAADSASHAEIERDLNYCLRKAKLRLQLPRPQLPSESRRCSFEPSIAQ